MKGILMTEFILAELVFGTAHCTSIELENGDYHDEPDAIGTFRFVGVTESGLPTLIRECLSAVFDGDLDDPDLFEEIELVGVDGPSQAHYSDRGIQISGATVYLRLKLSTKDDVELDDVELDDLFHLVVLQFESDGAVAQFSEWEDYSVQIIDTLPNVRPASIRWSRN
jgi:hypothetical protein